MLYRIEDLIDPVNKLNREYLIEACPNASLNTSDEKIINLYF